MKSQKPKNMRILLKDFFKNLARQQTITNDDMGIISWKIDLCKRIR